MSEENKPEEEFPNDPVLDMTMMQARLDEQQERLDEQEFFITALQDNHRLTLMNHLLPHYLSDGMGVKSAIKKAKGVADDCIDVLAEEMNAKAVKYRQMIEEQREAAKKSKVALETDESEVAN